jgi:hypothetical protein
MDSFAGLVLRASKAMGAPLYLAKRLGVEPYDVYRWIAGTVLPEAVQQKEFERRLLSMLENKRVDPEQIERRGKHTRRWSDCPT